jgi:hypothetical protein
MSLQDKAHLGSVSQEQLRGARMTAARQGTRFTATRDRRHPILHLTGSTRGAHCCTRPHLQRQRAVVQLLQQQRGGSAAVVHRQPGVRLQEGPQQGGVAAGLQQQALGELGLGSQGLLPGLLLWRCCCCCCCCCGARLNSCGRAPCCVPCLLRGGQCCCCGGLASDGRSCCAAAVRTSRHSL